jgi:PAS domain S-box-containing protein
MNTLSIPVVAMASISLYVGLYHLLIYFRRRQNREDLTFSFLCFAYVFYAAFCVGLYNATSVIEGAQWQRAQFIALAVFVTAFLWFVSDYTRQKPGTPIYLMSIFLLLAIIVQFVDRSDLTFLVDQPSIKHITLPYVQPITYYEASLGPFTMLQGLMGIAASTYILLMGIRYFRQGHKREARPLILAIGLMYAAGFHDTLVSNGVYDFIYLIEYAYLAVILMMAYSLSNTVVKAAIAKEELKTSEERIRSLVETTSDWVWEVDANGVYTYASPKVRDLLGYEPDEIIGRTPFDLMPAEEAERVRVIFQTIALNKKPLERVENMARRKDGQLIVLETSGVPFLDGDGKLLGYRGIDRDITERKRAEAQIERTLRETRVRFEVSQVLARAETEEEVLDVLIHHAGLYPQAFVAIFIFDRTGGELVAILRRQDTFESGLTAVMSIGDSLPASRFTLFGHFSADQPFVSEDVTADQRLEPTGREVLKQTGVVSFAAIPLTVGNEWMGYIGVMAEPAGYFDDERLQLYQTLAEQGAMALRAARLRETIRESQQRLSLLVQQSPLAVIEWDTDFRVVSWNPAAERIFGYSANEALGCHMADLIIPPAARPLVEQAWRALLAQRGGANLTHDNVTKAGLIITCEWFDAPLISADGQAIGLASLIQDISERRRTEQALQAKTEELDRYFTSSLDLLCIADTDGYFRRLNPEWEKTLGYTIAELEGRQFLELVHPEDVEATVATISRLRDQQQILNFENRYRCKDGTYRWIEWRSYPVEKVVYAVARDITERKRVEEALRESEQKFRLFVEQSSDGLVFTDEHGIVIEWNQTQEHLTGLSRQECIGRPLWDVQLDVLSIAKQTPRQSQELEQKILLALETGQGDFLDRLVEIELFHRDGTRVIAQQLAFGIKTNQGYRLGSIIRDITKLKQVEEELRVSEEKYRRLVEASPIPMWINQGEIITYVNPSALRVLGATHPEQIVGRPILDFVHPDYHAVVKERISQMREEGRTAPLLEEKYLRLDGNPIDVEVIATPFTTSTGPVIQVLFQDITNRKQAEQALRESEERLRQIASSLRETIWLRDVQTRQVLYVNPAFEELTGWTCESFYEQPDIVMNAIHPDDKEWVIEALAQRFKGVPYNKEHRITHRDGSVRWVSSRSFPVRNEAGEVYRWASIMEDITERKQAETERERLIAELENKNAELERFAYTVSHDLKAPLITIRGFLGYIEKDVRSGNLNRLKEDIQRISTATDKMQRLLSDLLELSRIGRLMNPPEKIAFGDLIQEVIKLMEERLRERNVEIKIQDDLPVVRGDSQRLLEVVQNLLDNAVKFMGEQTSPVIEIGTQGEENGMPVFYIRDNGIGIAPEHHDRIFGLFNKLDPRAEGTGVGLAIVKRILEVHGGTIWVESQPGKGTTFYFTFGKGTQGPATAIARSGSE